MSVWAKALGCLELLVLIALVSGCTQTVQVSAMFAPEVQVSPGADVWFGQGVIGEVRRISKEGDGTRVFIALDPDESKGLMKGAAAAPVTRDDVAGIEIFNFRSGQEPLGDGDELVGLNNALEYFSWQSRETLDFTSGALSTFTTSVQNYFDSEEWQSQKKEMEQSFAQLGADVQSAVEDMLRDYEALVEELQARSEQNSEQIGRQLDEITTMLQQQIQELLQNNEAALTDSLQELLDRLEQTLKQYSVPKEQQKTAGSPA